MEKVEVGKLAGVVKGLHGAVIADDSRPRADGKAFWIFETSVCLLLSASEHPTMYVSTCSLIYFREKQYRGSSVA